MILPRDRQKEVKVFYLDSQQHWREYARASLCLDVIQQSCTMRLALKHPLQLPELALLPHPHILDPLTHTLHIELERITQTERTEDNILALSIDEWNRVLSLSFRDEPYCDLIAEQLELHTNARTALPCHEDSLMKYVAEQLDTNPYFIEAFLSSEEVIENFLKQARKCESTDDPMRKVAFRAVKLLFLRADKSTLCLLLQPNNYELLLFCLSLNYEFGDRAIAYHEEYQKTAKAANLLAITDATVLEKYQQNIRIRFLTHVAAAMFIEPAAQSMLAEILNDNSLALFEFLVHNPDVLAAGAKLADRDPQSFLLLFSQLWQTYKSIMEDVRSVPVKRAFKDTFITQNLLNVAFQSVKRLAGETRGSGRLYQQFLEALNPCLSHKWNESQELLLFLFEQRRTHLLELLLAILKVGDCSTKAVVLVFAKNLVEVTENRPKMKQAFLNYFFGQFVTKCTTYFASTEELQLLVDFLMRLYRLDLVRTRHALIESGLLPQLTGRLRNKYVLILVLKLLRFFLEFSNDGIFQYITRHRLFDTLRELYFQSKKYSPHGIVHSLFLGMLKDLIKTENAAGLKYLHSVMCPEKKE